MSKVAEFLLEAEEENDGVSINGKTASQGVSIDDFYAYMPSHTYIYAPTGEMWPASSIKARLPPIADGGQESNSGEHVARSEPAGRTDDLGAGIVHGDP